MRVACFGREGSYAHQAALRRFGSTASYLACPTHAQVVDALLAKRSTVGVLPLENSISGVVMESIDALVAPRFVHSRLRIREHLETAPQLALLSNQPMHEIRRVYSHPYPLRYLAGWIRKNLPGAEVFETVSTSEAAQLASEQAGAAAIAGPHAARIYKLKCLRARLSKASEYLTRFAVIAPRPIAGARRATHAVLAFGLKHRPGALAAALTLLARHDLNLTRILSRPLAQRTGKFEPDAYLFWVDVDIRVGKNIFPRALHELKRHTTFLDVLGEYFIR